MRIVVALLAALIVSTAIPASAEREPWSPSTEAGSGCTDPAPLAATAKLAGGEAEDKADQKPTQTQSQTQRTYIDDRKITYVTRKGAFGRHWFGHNNQTPSRRELVKLLRTAEFKRLPERYRDEIRQALVVGIVATEKEDARPDSDEFKRLSPYWQNVIVSLRAYAKAVKYAKKMDDKHREWAESEHAKLQQQLDELKKQMEDNAGAIFVLAVVAIVVLALVLSRD